MSTPTFELEGTWEEIMAHADELAGCRVRLQVIPVGSEPKASVPALTPANQRMLDLLDEWERAPLSADEQAVLDGLEEHLLQTRRDAPITAE